MCIINRFVSSVAVAAFVVAATSAFVAPASANTYDLDFTDTNGDVAALVLTTTGAYGLVNTITGTFDGLSVSETNFAGSDNIIYSSGPLVDYPGIAWTNGTPYNLYWTNEVRSFSTPGPLGLCYVYTCNEVSGFYRLTSGTLNGQPLEGITATPVPSTWTMLIAGFVGLFGFVAFGGKKRNAAATAAA